MRESNDNQPITHPRGVAGSPSSRGRILWTLWAAWTLLAAILALARALPPDTGPVAGVERRLVDLTSDPVPVLALLPGLGPQRAEAIVLDRIRNGPVRTWEQLQRIHGFGPGIVAAIRPFATLGDHSAVPEESAARRPIR